MDIVATLRGLHALHTAGTLTAEEFALAKAGVIGAISGPGSAAAPAAAAAPSVKLEPPAPPAAVAADRVGALGGGRRVAARAGPEPTCVRSANCGAAGVGAAAPGLQLLKVRRGYLSVSVYLN